MERNRLLEFLLDRWFLTPSVAQVYSQEVRVSYTYVLHSENQIKDLKPFLSLFFTTIAVHEIGTFFKFINVFVSCACNVQ
jgi:hypothetical protein